MENIIVDGFGKNIDNFKQTKKKKKTEKEKATKKWLLLNCYWDWKGNKKV